MNIRELITLLLCFFTVVFLPAYAEYANCTRSVCCISCCNQLKTQLDGTTQNHSFSRSTCVSGCSDDLTTASCGTSTPEEQRSCAVGRELRTLPFVTYNISETNQTSFCCTDGGSIVTDHRLIPGDQCITSSPSVSPTKSPTEAPTQNPTVSPTKSPTHSPTRFPTPSPTKSPTPFPTPSPTQFPTNSPVTKSPTRSPTTPTIPVPIILPTAKSNVVIIAGGAVGGLALIAIIFLLVFRRGPKPKPVADDETSKESSDAKNIDDKPKLEDIMKTKVDGGENGNNKPESPRTGLPASSPFRISAALSPSGVTVDKVNAEQTKTHKSVKRHTEHDEALNAGDIDVNVLLNSSDNGMKKTLKPSSSKKVPTVPVAAPVALTSSNKSNNASNEMLNILTTKGKKKDASSKANTSVKTVTKPGEKKESPTKEKSAARPSPKYLEKVMEDPLRASIFRPSKQYIEENVKKEEAKKTLKKTLKKTEKLKGKVELNDDEI